MSDLRRDLLVVGAGPAGLAGAARAAECGLVVTLVDDNPTVGGQIWRGAAGGAAGEWAARVRAAGVTVLTGTRIVDQPMAGMLRAERGDEIVDLPYRKLLLATGARERFLPFPGWTLPHVLGAGGLQAMVKGGLPITGKRVVVAGTGPLLIAVAAYLREHGAVIAALCEQANWGSLAEFGMALTSAKMRAGLHFARILRGVRQRAGTWPVEARAGGVVLNRGGFLACDYVACGFHLIPNTELAALLGCAMQSGCVVVNDRQETTVEDVYCAGEPTGIGGLDLALAEGEIAGLAAAERAEPGLAELPELIARREKHRGFAAKLEKAFGLRAELRGLARTETIVCRCEDVTLGRIQAQGSWRAAKLQTRCGMGPCQGRVCGGALEFLLGWAPESVRPPIYPARVGALARGENG